MKKLALLLYLLCLTACDRQEQPVVAASQTPDCTKIISSVERLACFDSVARTPAHEPPPAASASTSSKSIDASQAPPIVALVQDNEARRQLDDTRFRLTRATDSSSGSVQIVISAPALGSESPRSLMAISCLSHITRLQVITGKPIPSNRIRMRLQLDGQPIADAAAWQVLDIGTVVDAGRGLVAIDVLKHLGNGHRLQTESDYAPLDGLIFDADGLHELIAQQRVACRW